MKRCEECELGEMVKRCSNVRANGTTKCKPNITREQISREKPYAVLSGCGRRDRAHQGEKERHGDAPDSLDTGDAPIKPILDLIIDMTIEHSREVKTVELSQMVELQPEEADEAFLLEVDYELDQDQDKEHSWDDTSKSGLGRISMVEQAGRLAVAGTPS